MYEDLKFVKVAGGMFFCEVKIDDDRVTLMQAVEVEDDSQFKLIIDQWLKHKNLGQLPNIQVEGKTYTVQPLTQKQRTIMHRRFADMEEAKCQALPKLINETFDEIR